MDITPIGWLLIPVGVLLFVFYPAGLYALTIFFVPFTATSILNSGSGETGSGIQPYMFFGLMLLIRDFVNIIWRMKLSVPRSLRKAMILYALFIAVCGISLIMPIVINGKIVVPSNGLLSATLEPLVFNVGRVKIFLGLVYGFLLTVCIARRNLTLGEFVRTAKIYLSSGVFVCLWGLVQLGLYFTNIPYPYMIFNNSASPNAGGYAAVLDDVAMRRVSSVALEPSTLAITLIGMISLLIIPVFSRVRIFGKHLDIAFGTLMLVTLRSNHFFYRITRSWIALPVLAFRNIRARKTPKAHPDRNPSSPPGDCRRLRGSPSGERLHSSDILNKSGSYSALERWTIVYIDFEYFLKYPLLGLGWGSVPTHDTIAGMLSSCGVIGLMSFAALMGYIVGELRDHLNALISSRTIKIVSGACFYLSARPWQRTWLAAYRVGDILVISALAMAVVGLDGEISTRDSLIWESSKI